jgi:L-iditol 2-dehydrogenase
LHFASHAALEWQPFGHEIAGVVRAVASDVTRFGSGDRVALDSSAPCGECEECEAGRPLDCTNPRTFWGDYMGFATAMITPHQCVYHAAELPFDVACLLEPLGVAIDLVQTAEISSGDRVLILGPGPLGLMAIPLCLQNGASEVFLAGRSHSKARLQRGETLGAKIIETDTTPLREYSFGSDINKILVTSPPATLPEAFHAGSVGSIIAFVGCGFGPDSIVTFDADAFHFKRQQLRASMASPAIHGAQALKILQGNLFDPRLILSHHFPLDDIGTALATARHDKENAVKIVVVP